MTTTPPLIYTLPAARRTYDTRVHHPDPGNEEECSICYRVFNKRDDPEDLSEVPCQPLRLQPCNHVVGSECLSKMIKASMDTCQFCRTEITMLSDPFPRWLQRATSWPWYTLYCDYTPSYARKAGKSEDFTQLSKNLFDGEISLQDSTRLWWFYMDSLSAWSRTIIMIGLFIKLVFAFSAWSLQTLFFELWIVRVVPIPGFGGAVIRDSKWLALSMDLPLLVVLFLLGASHQMAHGNTGEMTWMKSLSIFLMARVFDLSMSFMGLLYLLAANYGIFGGLTGMLIGYGRKS